MTSLTISPDHSKKTAKITGTIAAGEVVAVTITGAKDWITATLRLRVVGAGGETLAQFEKDSEAGIDWSYSGENATCELNLNTVEMMAAVPRGATTPFLFVLDDPDDETLYFKSFHPVTHWPQRVGEDSPADLGGYRDFVEECRAAMQGAAGSALDYKNQAEAAAEAARLAKTAAESAESGSAGNANRAGQMAVRAEEARDDATAAKAKAEQAQSKAEQAEQNAGVAAGHAVVAERDAGQSASSAALAKQAAESAQGRAESARDLAEGYKGDALAAKTAAETAQGLAESARDTADGYKTAANSAKTDAVAAKTAAESARDLAQGYKGDALTAKTGAESARDLAQGYKNDAEAAAIRAAQVVDNKIDHDPVFEAAAASLFSMDTELALCATPQDVAIVKLSQLLGEDVSQFATTT